MNPLTNVRNITKMNERELELGYVNTNNSWHRQYKDSAWIFIGGLNFDLTEGDVICVFSQFGEVVNINMVRDPKTGKSRGFAFLCYEDQRSTVLAVDNLNGQRVAGHITRVDHVADYKPPKAKGDNEGLQEWEGCGPEVLMRLQPMPEETAPPSEEKKEEKSKKEKKKKKKKEKKKKKKKKRRESGDSDSSESSSQSGDQPTSSQTPWTQIPRAAESSPPVSKKPTFAEPLAEHAGPSRARSPSPDRRERNRTQVNGRSRNYPERNPSSNGRRRRDSPLESERRRESPPGSRRYRDSSSEARRRRDSPSEDRRYRDASRNYRRNSRERSRSPVGRRR